MMGSYSGDAWIHTVVMMDSTVVMMDSIHAAVMVDSYNGDGVFTQR